MAECFHLANVLEGLETLGILDSLQQEISIAALARRHRVDARLLEAALEFLTMRTDLLV